MRKEYIISILILLLVFLMTGCFRLKGDFGIVRVYVESTPIPIEGVEHFKITISKAYAHQLMRGYQSLLLPETSTNFSVINLDLVNTIQNPTQIIFKHIEEAKYTEIKFIISKAEITINGKTYNMEISKENITIPCIFTIDRNYILNIYLAFFAENSIQILRKDNTYRFILNPVFKVYSITREHQ